MLRCKSAAFNVSPRTSRSRAARSRYTASRVRPTRNPHVVADKRVLLAARDWDRPDAWRAPDVVACCAKQGSSLAPSGRCCDGREAKVACPRAGCPVGEWRGHSVRASICRAALMTMGPSGDMWQPGSVSPNRNCDVAMIVPLPDESTCEEGRAVLRSGSDGNSSFRAM
jgi:hypothetical protein